MDGISLAVPELVGGARFPFLLERVSVAPGRDDTLRVTCHVTRLHQADRPIRARREVDVITAICQPQPCIITSNYDSNRTRSICCPISRSISPYAIVFIFCLFFDLHIILGRYELRQYSIYLTESISGNYQVVWWLKGPWFKPDCGPMIFP